MAVLCITYHTAFHGGWIIFHSYQQCIRVSISPHPLHTLSFPFFFPSPSESVWYNSPSWFWVKFPNNANNVQHLFMYLFVICTSSLEKSLLKSFAHCILGYLFFLPLLFGSRDYLDILDTEPRSGIQFADILPHSASCLFIFSSILWCTKIFGFHEIQSFYFSFLTHTFSVST
jgi:hypothetical protein